MAKKFVLPEMSCTLGGKVITTGDGDGEKREELVKGSLAGLMLNSKQLDKVLGNGAHGRLFNQHKGEDIKPAFGDDVNELKLVHRYVDCSVTLSLDDETVTMPAAKIMNVVLQRHRLDSRAARAARCAERAPRNLGRRLSTRSAPARPRQCLEGHARFAHARRRHCR